MEQPNPAAIVSGFGGTLNLVLGLAFMLAVIVPFGIVFHWHAMGFLTGPQYGLGLAGAAVWLTIVTVATTSIPLWLGSRSLAAREF